MGIRIEQAGLTIQDAEREAHIARALEALDSEWMLSTLASLVNTPSPTGEERLAAEYLASVMEDAGIASRLQVLDTSSANVIGELGDKAGPSVLIFAPLDSATSGVAEEEVPWVGP